MGKRNIKKIKKELEEIIINEQNKLKLEKAALDARIIEINKKVANIPRWEKRLIEIKDEIAHLNLLKKEKINYQKELYALKKSINLLKKENLKIEKLGKELAYKINLLNKSKSVCPICERKLTTPYTALMLSSFKKNYLEHKNNYKKNLKIINYNKKKATYLEDKIREIDIILLGKEELERQRKFLTQELEEAVVEKNNLSKMYEQKKYLEKEISNKSFAPLSQRLLKKIKDKENE